MPKFILLPVLAICSVLAVHAAPVTFIGEWPVSVSRLPDGTVLADFGKVAFGNLALQMPSVDGAPEKITVHFGEAFSDGRVNRRPPGTVRYARVAEVPFRAEKGRPLKIAPQADRRNTNVKMNAVLTPPEWGVVLPFRWVEIEGWPADQPLPELVRGAAFALTWDDTAAAFESSDDTLNRIWELCRYSIKATTFAGVYVDGDRERIPYEADAYLNQLSHYYCDPDPQMARDTFDYLLKYPTWPTEWALHMPLIAHADWMRTGDTAWLRERYAALKPKLLMERANAGGLLETPPEQMKNDIVDWPVGERDGFVFKPVNTVVNAFYIHALNRMSELASALGETNEATDFSQKAKRATAAFQRELFDAASGTYRDGVGTGHASLHANLFPLAFGLVPEERVAGVVAFLKNKGMRCSVYAAQYLMEALFVSDVADTALALMLADGDRSWRHMLDSGTTITWEAWDQRYKPNQDWNHAWGAAPANLLPRFVLGVEPVSPGWKTIRIRPNPGTLAFCRGKVPSVAGPVKVAWHKDAAFFAVSDTRPNGVGPGFVLEFSLPAGTAARLELPVAGEGRVWVDGKQIKAERRGAWLHVAGEWRGTQRVEVW